VHLLGTREQVRDGNREQRRGRGECGTAILFALLFQPPLLAISWSRVRKGAKPSSHRRHHFRQQQHYSRVEVWTKGLRSVHRKFVDVGGHIEMALVDECRLCGTDTLNRERYAIFDGEGRNKKFARKIEDCLRIQVREIVQI
jgi:hypothetical protein